MTIYSTRMDLLKTKFEQLKKMNKMKAATTVRFLRRWLGIIAVSGNRIWTTAKPMRHMPPTVSSTIIRPSFHWRLLVKLAKKVRR